MKTEGKPVDSVIQYQLHKDSSDSAESRPRIVNETYLGIKAITQEDIDNYLIDSSQHLLNINTEYHVYEIPVNFSDLKNSLVFINRSDKDVSEFINEYHHEYEDEDGDFSEFYLVLGIGTSWYCTKNNLNLRRYVDIK